MMVKLTGSFSDIRRAAKSFFLSLKNALYYWTELLFVHIQIMKFRLSCEVGLHAFRIINMGFYLIFSRFLNFLHLPCFCLLGCYNVMHRFSERNCEEYKPVFKRKNKQTALFYRNPGDAYRRQCASRPTDSHVLSHLPQSHGGAGSQDPR